MFEVEFPLRVLHSTRDHKTFEANSINDTEKPSSSRKNILESFCWKLSHSFVLFIWIMFLSAFFFFSAAQSQKLFQKRCNYAPHDKLLVRVAFFTFSRPKIFIWWKMKNSDSKLLRPSLVKLIVEHFFVFVPSACSGSSWK